MERLLRAWSTRYAFANTPRFVNPYAILGLPEPWQPPPELSFLPRVNGYVIYNGPSQLDGRPIVVVLAGMVRASENTKIGERLLQTFILTRDMHPQEAVVTGADSTICGSCAHRGELVGGKNVGRSCYVIVGKSVTAVWNAFQHGQRPEIPIAALGILARSLGRLGLGVRLGTYGDPAAVPIEVWEELLGLSRGDTRPRFQVMPDGHYVVEGGNLPFWTGYSHQWKLPQAQAHKAFLMASVDSLDEAAEAQALGWQTFRISRQDEPRVPGVEITCPASPEAYEERRALERKLGRKLPEIHCDTCFRCMGAVRPGQSIVIRPHGSGARFHEEREHNPEEELRDLIRHLLVDLDNLELWQRLLREAGRRGLAVLAFHHPFHSFHVVSRAYYAYSIPGMVALDGTDSLGNLEGSVGASHTLDIQLQPFAERVGFHACDRCGVWNAAPDESLCPKCKGRFPGYKRPGGALPCSCPETGSGNCPVHGARWNPDEDLRELERELGTSTDRGLVRRFVVAAIRGGWTHARVLQRLMRWERSHGGFGATFMVDEAHIGTPFYLGFGWFWNHAYRHYHGGLGATFMVDEAHIGTPFYLGFGWFWNHAYRHYLSYVKPVVRRRVHAAWLKAGLKLDEVSEAHDSILSAIVREQVNEAHARGPRRRRNPHDHPSLKAPVDRLQVEGELARFYHEAGFPGAPAVSWPNELTQLHERVPRRYAQVFVGQGRPRFELAEQTRWLDRRHRKGLLAHEVGHAIAPGTEKQANRAACEVLDVDVAYDPRWGSAGGRRGLQVAVNPDEELRGAARDMVYMSPGDALRLFHKALRAGSLETAVQVRVHAFNLMESLGGFTDRSGWYDAWSQMAHVAPRLHHYEFLSPGETIYSPLRNPDEDLRVLERDPEHDPRRLGIERQRRGLCPLCGSPRAEPGQVKSSKGTRLCVACYTARSWWGWGRTARPNPDENLRVLERAASTGDHEALKRLVWELWRRGDVERLLAIADAYDDYSIVWGVVNWLAQQPPPYDHARCELMHRAYAVETAVWDRLHSGTPRHLQVAALLSEVLP